MSRILICGLVILSGVLLLAQEEEPSVIKKLEPSIVFIRHEQAGGSGFIISPDGYIITNGHVVMGDTAGEEDPKAVAKKITVVLSDDTKLSAKVIGHSLDPDVALIKVEPLKPLPVIELGDSDSVRSGDKVYAYGAPMGMRRSVTAGIVSNTERVDIETFTKVIQTDAAINPGNSGGPLLSETGKVLGLNTYGGGGEGLGFTIPINVAKVLKDHFIKYGYFRRATFPFFIPAQIYDEMAVALGVERGVLVDFVLPGSPAAIAGLQSGDIIIEVNGQPVSARNESQLRDFKWLLTTMEIGSTINLKLLRGRKGNYQEYLISGTLEESEPQVEHDVQVGELKEIRYDDLGLSIKQMTTLTSIFYNIPNIPGVRVVKSTGPAEKANISANDLITHIDNQPVKDTNEFISLLNKCLSQKQKFILITLCRSNDTINTVIKPNYELADKNIVLLLPDGTVDYLDVVSQFLITNGCKVTTLIAGKEKIEIPSFDALILLSGPNAQALWSDEQVHEIIRTAVKEKKVLGAIGAASVALVNADPTLLEKKITTEESCSKNMLDKNAKYTGKDVEQDGLIVTSTGFSKKVVKQFLSELRNAIKRK